MYSKDLDDELSDDEVEIDKEEVNKLLEEATGSLETTTIQTSDQQYVAWELLLQAGDVQKLLFSGMDTGISNRDFDVINRKSQSCRNATDLWLTGIHYMCLQWV